MGKIKDYAWFILKRICSVYEGYSDASWISNRDDLSSTSGFVFLLGRCAISWASKKQTCIADSSMTSEFSALSSASKEAEWLNNLMIEIPLLLKPISPIAIHCDNDATLASAYSQVYNGMSRHFGVQYSYIQELIKDRVITVDYVWTTYNLADCFIKDLTRDTVKRMSIGFRLEPFVDHEWENLNLTLNKTLGLKFNKINSFTLMIEEHL